MSGHKPVMIKECLEFFSDVKIGSFYEGTLGAGGHAKAILDAHPEIECYIGCDRDPNAIKIAREELKPWAEKMVFVNDNFSQLKKHLKEQGLDSVDGFFLIWGYHRCS